ncbi:MAG: MATE family efflux transporter [Clostridia bacterium]|nr:MATE family efflux transporter [Clostridia bacterium]
MFKKLMALFGTQDLTQGKPMTGLLQFSIPLLIGNFAQQLYNTVDSIVVGKYIGDNALSAVGASGPVLNLLLVLFIGIATGAGIMVAQYFGAKDRKMLSKTVGTTLTLTFLVSLLMTVVGVFAAPALLELLQTPAAFIQDAKDYLVIIFAGFIGMAFYNIVSGILRGMGDSVYPLIYLIISTLLNVVLDIWFVASTGKVAGVAWATIIAQGISAVLCIIRLLKMKDVLDVNRQTLKPSRSLSVRLFKLGIPAGVTQAIFSLSAILVQSLANSLETLTALPIVAAQTAVMRVDGFCMLPNMTFGNAATTFVGQNIGAGRMDRVKTGTRDAMKLGLICSTLLTVCILLFGKQLMSLFTNTPDVIQLGERWMRILAVGYIAFTITQVLSGVMRGVGETMIPMWISMITTVGIRMVLAYGLVALTKSPAWPNGNPTSLQYSLVISWVSGALMTTLAFFKSKWRERAVLPTLNEDK